MGKSAPGGSHYTKKTFGLAKHYYRVRVVTLVEEIPADFDWRDDILFRNPDVPPPKTRRRYLLQLVRTDEGVSTDLGEYKKRPEAEQAFASSVEDLAVLTKREFDVKYRLA